MEVEKILGHDVLLHGLKARADLNGLVGEASSFDADKGRFTVKMPGSAKPLLLKPENLERTPECSSAIAACCAAEHAEEVRERVRAVRMGSDQDDDAHMQHVLDLEDTGLRELPACVGTLGLTRELWLGNNGLASLPNALGSLVALKQLDIDGNALTALPDSIASLVALEALYANRNRFARLPAALASLRALRELRLSDNQLSATDALPAELGYGLGRHLKALWLARNGLEVVPACVCELLVLEELDLTQNAKLTSLPAGLAALAKLTTLELAGNDALVWPPTDVAAQGATAVRTWLRSPPLAALSTLPLFAPGVPGSAARADIQEDEMQTRCKDEMRYAHEARGSMHRPLAPESLGGSSAPDGSGGEFIFPAMPMGRLPFDVSEGVAADASPPPASLVGARVLIAGLASRTDLNGKYGKALSYDAASGRYKVSLEGAADGRTYNLKPVNLTSQRPLLWAEPPPLEDHLRYRPRTT